MEVCLDIWKKILKETNKEEKNEKNVSKYVQRRHLKLAFDNYNRKDDDMMIKLAKLHIIENFLLGNQDKATINEKYIDMLYYNGNQDKATINEKYIDMLYYNWMVEEYHQGRISFKETINSFKAATAKQRLNSYPLYGCPIALQIWVFEIIYLTNRNLISKGSGT
ncbi:hypothetical protein PanWU01x14_206900 [Parasponia andersonii]|uniref:Uncharacterized protein n=1 Tax=Parasponia andersonii TaxID=3476 RepID=A0A2P5BVC5_PARAD|nr:hypothetical protein PanWU01x14_206900 [Parasponia andersonii]